MLENLVHIYKWYLKCTINHSNFIVLIDMAEPYGSLNLIRHNSEYDPDAKLVIKHVLQVRQYKK